MRTRMVWIFTLLLAGVLAVSGTAVAITNPEPTSIVYFASEDFSLDKTQKDALDALVPQLDDATKVVIDGYVQRSTEANKNKGPDALSFKRANTVAKYLESQVKQRSKNKQPIEWVIAGKGQPFTGFWSPNARRAVIFISTGPVSAETVAPTETATPVPTPTPTSTKKNGK